MSRSSLPVTASRSSAFAGTIAELLRRDLVVRRTEHPRLHNVIDGLAYRGRLRAVLPGVLAAAEHAGDPRVRIAALMAADPDAVLGWEAAAALSYWPDAPVRVVAAYRPGWPAGAAGFAWHRGQPPADLVVQRGGLRLTAPALTVLDLIPEHGGSAIDRGLRCGITLDALREALARTPHRAGNTLRRQLLADSRDEPWSEAERLGHRLLRAAGLRGWHANVRVAGPDGPIVDVAWLRLRVAIEFDGWRYHAGRERSKRIGGATPNSPRPGGRSCGSPGDSSWSRRRR